jgi:hypothetical protein
MVISSNNSERNKNDLLSACIFLFFGGGERCSGTSRYHASLIPKFDEVRNAKYKVFDKIL